MNHSTLPLCFTLLTMLLGLGAALHADDVPSTAATPTVIMERAPTVVLGARGLGLARRILMGSVSSTVLHALTSQVPVVIVRPPTGEPATARRASCCCCSQCDDAKAPR